MPPYPYEVRVQQLDGSAKPYVVLAGAQDAPLLTVSPRFADWDKAATVAAHLARGLREAKVLLVPTITIADADLLYQAIREEGTQAVEAWYDDRKHAEPTDLIGVWLRVLASIEAPTDGILTLDFDQAQVVSELLPTAIETSEDLELTEGDTHRLRLYGIAIARVGFPLRFVGDVGPYDIRLEDASKFPYRVLCGDQSIGVAATVTEACRILIDHRGPAPGTQPKIKIPPCS